MKWRCIPITRSGNMRGKDRFTRIGLSQRKTLQKLSNIEKGGTTRRDRFKFFRGDQSQVISGKHIFTELSLWISSVVYTALRISFRAVANQIAASPRLAQFWFLNIWVETFVSGLSCNLAERFAAPSSCVDTKSPIHFLQFPIYWNFCGATLGKLRKSGKHRSTNQISAGDVFWRTGMTF